MINADAFTPTDERSIPTGEIRPVEGTAFDFRQPKLIGRDIAQTTRSSSRTGAMTTTSA